MLIYLERPEEALDSCEQALTVEPDDFKAWVFRGVALHRLGQYQQAYYSYDQALGIHRNPPKEKHGQSVAMFVSHFVSKTFAQLRQAIA
jgi:Flp pilus assembly protein TadD